MNLDLTRIEYPWLLLSVLVLPLAFALLLRHARTQRQRRLMRLGALDMVRRLVPASAVGGGGWRATRLGVVAALAGVALAGPRWGFERTTVASSGIDLVLAVDVSLSMTATDEKPSRLERVKQEIRRLRELSPGDRIGLLAFAGKSYILSPITVDGGALDLFLDNLDPSVVGQAGSSIAQTITQGTNLLALSKSGADRALVVFSDGEAFELPEDIVSAAKRAADNNVSLVTVGFGTTAGATIPIKEGNRVVEKQDEHGQVVVTKYSPTLLQAAAAAANGTFIPAEATDKATRIRAALSKLRTRARTAQTGDNLSPRYGWFLLPAVLLLWLDTVLAGRRGRRRRRVATAETALSGFVVALIALQGCTMPHESLDAVTAYNAKQYQRAVALFGPLVTRGDSTPGMLYNYGTALLAADSVPAALAWLGKAADTRDPETRYRAHFNAGVAYLRLGLVPKSDSAKSSLDSALAVYKLVLLQRPTDPDAKWNYELALRKPSGGGGGGANGAPTPAAQQPKPQPTLAERQAEQILGSAAREERDVQGKRQKSSKPEPPPGGKDW